MSVAPKPSGSGPLKSQFAADPEMSELVELFVSELPGRIDALTSAWTQRRVAELTRMAHQLKASGSGYGFPTIGQAAAALETRLRSLNGGAAESVLETLGGEFRHLIELCSRACAGGR